MRKRLLMSVDATILAHMSQIENPWTILEQRARDAGMTIARVCVRAKVAKSTASRGKKGSLPNIKTLRRMEAALEELVAEKSEAATAER